LLRFGRFALDGGQWKWKNVPYVTPREKLLLRRFAAGKTNNEIAKDLGDTENRVSAQRQRLAEKFEIQTQEQLLAIANKLAAILRADLKRSERNGCFVPCICLSA
jgi:DNA-binding CsgD family transcriptional regulator